MSSTRLKLSSRAAIKAPLGKIDLAVFIGRFQPGPHNGHLHVIRTALEKAHRVGIVIGSATGPRSHHNPFTYDERRHMIEACLTEEERKRVSTIAASDHLYSNEAWIEDVTRAVTTLARATAGPNATIALIGHRKDASSFYLKMFPGWGSTEVENHGSFSATPMRSAYFQRGGDWLDGGARTCLPEGVRQFLAGFAKTAAFEEIVEEYAFIRKYRAQRGPGPFVTTDAVVVQAGQVLLIQRGGRPGKGQWALPGGFLDIARNETLLDSMVRELREETDIRLGNGDPEVVERTIRRAVRHQEAFDAPFRDPRARIITHAFLVLLEGSGSGGLPPVKGSSDAAYATWIPLADLHESQIFADHLHIIRRMIGMIPKTAI